QGIMTEVVKKFADYCLTERGLSRLEANVFEHNVGSIKVLEKAGFEKEGYLKKAYLKNGDFINGYLFAKIN
ncbi:MAG: GNAT family protein, partial [Bacteroidota bacterium]